MRKRKIARRQTAARKLIASVNPRSVITEQFRTIRTNINFALPDKEVQTILFTSSSSGEGKSTNAANVAIVFAQEGKKVLLMDADMRKPTMHYTFNTRNSPGLSNILTRQWGFEDVKKITEFKGLDLLTCGPIPPNPAELLSSQSMKLLLNELKKAYDIIILDGPPVLLVADSQILSNICDGTILIINSGVTEKSKVIKAKEALQTSKACIIGAVLNNFKLEKSHSHYYTYNTVE